MTLNVGESETLTATITPSDATDKAVTWTSGNTNVATVAGGKVTAKNIGTATITATTSNGMTATCTVTVIKRATGFKLNKTTLTLKVGQTEKLTAIITPSDATTTTIVWGSNNDSVQVDGNGNITAKAAGTAKIIAGLFNTGLSASCIVTVTDEVPATGIKLDWIGRVVDPGEEFRLTATVSPDNATNKTVTWTSDNSNVAEVSSSGYVTAKKEGTALITAATSNGLTATCQVTVRAAVIKPTAITLDQKTAKISAGSQLTLVATITPSNATDQTVTWTSDSPLIATVTNGVVYAGDFGGEATITASTYNGLTASCVVTVLPQEVLPREVWIGYTTLSMETGDSKQISATVYPIDATDKTLTWSSSNQSVATVDGSGKVTAVKAGTATITAETKNGIKNKVTITVEDKTVYPTDIKLHTKTLLLEVGDYEMLYATVTPSNAEDKTVTWTSSDDKVATVQNGKVKAVKEGTATITARTCNWIKATCTVTVVRYPTKVRLNRSSKSLSAGESFTLSATVSPSNAYNKKVDWDTSDWMIAIVDENGTVTALREGTAVITASTFNGKTDTCMVTVKKSKEKAQVDKVESVTKNDTDDPINNLIQDAKYDPGKLKKSYLNIFFTNGLSALYTPQEIVENFSEEDWPVLDYDNTALGEQTAVMTVMGQEVEIKVNIVPAAVGDASLDGEVTIFDATVIQRYLAEMEDFNERRRAIADTDGDKDVDSIDVTVLQRYIAQMIEEMGYTPTLTLDKQELIMKEDDSEQLIVDIQPHLAADDSLVWSSDNKQVAIVENGVVKGVGIGTATITVTSKLGLSAQCMVQVKDKWEGYYKIYTTQDLNRLRYNPRGNFVLMDDIDLGVYENWVPIPDEFSGEFNGNGHTINNMNVNLDNVGANVYDYDSSANKASYGLFSLAGKATFKDITLNCNFKLNCADGINLFVGGFVGESDDLKSELYFENCHVNCEIETQTSNACAYIGGFCGSAFEAEFNNCSVFGSIKCTATGAPIVAVDDFGGDIYHLTIAENCVSVVKKMNI